MHRKQGFTIVEILIITALSVLIISQLAGVGFEGSRIMDETTRSITLQTGIRSVLENMVHDINSTMAFLNTSNRKMIVARYDKPIDDDLILLNVNDTYKTFPFYMEGQQTKVQLPALFVEYEFFDDSNAGTDKLKSPKGTVTRKSKKGILISSDSPENSPYVIDTYEINTGALTDQVHRRLAEKIIYFNLDYYGYDEATGELKSIGELGSSDMVASKAAMVAIHMIAEDPTPQPNRKDPKVEIYTKAWSYKMIQENKYPEYFGHTDRDLRF
jgi:hypothetical protein